MTLFTQTLWLMSQNRNVLVHQCFTLSNKSPVLFSLSGNACCLYIGLRDDSWRTTVVSRMGNGTINLIWTLETAKQLRKSFITAAVKTQPKRYEFKMEKDDSVRNTASYFSSFTAAHCKKYPVGFTVKKRQLSTWLPEIQRDCDNVSSITTYDILLLLYFTYSIQYSMFSSSDFNLPTICFLPSNVLTTINIHKHKEKNL